MSEIAEFALVPAPSLTRLVDRMATDGLVHRTVDARDRRRVLVHLTPRRAARCIAARRRWSSSRATRCSRTPGRRTCGACRSCSRRLPAGSAEASACTRARSSPPHRSPSPSTGRAADLDAVLPGFTERDRVGVVVRRPLGGAGASLLVLAAVTGFYDEQRRRGEPFFIYPGLLRLPRRAAARRPPQARHLARPTRRWWWRTSRRRCCGPINDRAITRLVVEDGDGDGAPELARETLASARRRIVTCLAYAPRRPRAGRRHRDRRQRGHGALRGRDGRAVRRRAGRGAGRRRRRGATSSGTAGPSRPTGPSRSTRRSRGSADRRTARTLRRRQPARSPSPPAGGRRKPTLDRVPRGTCVSSSTLRMPDSGTTSERGTKHGAARRPATRSAACSGGDGA